MKKLTALLLTALMILAAVPITAAAGRFEDVPDGKWYSEGISFCAANGYMAGTSEALFDRNGTLTRAMFMTILAKVDGVDLSQYEGKSSFMDVKTDGWYTAAIEWGYQCELASGIGDGFFGYKNPVTREQMALFLYSYAEYVNSINFDVTVPDFPIEYSAPVIDTTPRADLSGFADSDRVHAWARDAMEWAVACELFSGVGEGYLDPRGNCTRAQTAVLIRAFVLNFLCDCEHEWSEPTCTEMSVCMKCELKNTTELGHNFPEHLCTESVKCNRCDVMSEITEHNGAEPTCTDDGYCIVCGQKTADAKGHDMKPATCTEASKCSRCTLTNGKPNGHNIIGANCTNGGFCLNCKKGGTPLGHTTTNGICSRCNSEIFATVHNKLVYYINTAGDVIDGVYKGYYQTYQENGFFDNYVYLTPGDPVVYCLTYRYSYDTEITYYTEIALTDSNGVYAFVSGAYDDGGMYYEITGIIEAEKAHDGEYTLVGYVGHEANREYAQAIVADLIPKALNLSAKTLAYEDLNLLGGYGFNLSALQFK